MPTSPNTTVEKLEAHLRSAPGHALLEKWLEWRGAQLAPKRSQVRIEDLGKALPFVILAEFTSPDELKFLLVGSELIRIQGVEFTGMNFYEMAQPDERDLRQRRLHTLEQQPCGSYSIQPGTLLQGAYLSTELLALPILPDEPDGSMRCLCVSVPLGNGRHQTPVEDSQIIRTAEEFRYIDIGAGLPEEDARLFCQPPLSI